MGLAMLIKGLLGVALPAFAIFIFLLFKKELGKIKELYPLLGILIIAIFGLPWYIAEYLIHGKAFLDFALGFLFLSRFQGAVSGHTGPWFYYFIALILGFAPWSHFLPLAFWKALKDWRNDPNLLCLCMIVPAFIVFSIAQTKIPNYVLPLYPFLAIMAAKLWDDLSNKPATERRGLLMSNIFLLIVISLIFIGVMIAGNNYSGAYQALVPNLQLLGAVLVIGALCSVFFALRSNYNLSFASLPIMVFIIAFILTMQTLPAVEKFKGTKELAIEISKVIKPNEVIAAYAIGNRPGVIFYNSKPVLMLNSEKEAINFIKARRGYCFTQISNLKRLEKYGKVFNQRGELAVII